MSSILKYVVVQGVLMGFLVVVLNGCVSNKTPEVLREDRISPTSISLAPLEDNFISGPPPELEINEHMVPLQIKPIVVSWDAINSNFTTSAPNSLSWKSIPKGTKGSGLDFSILSSYDPEKVSLYKYRSVDSSGVPNLKEKTEFN